MSILIDPLFIVYSLVPLQLNNMELTKQQSNVMAALRKGNDALKKAQREV